MRCQDQIILIGKPRSGSISRIDRTSLLLQQLDSTRELIFRADQSRDNWLKLTEATRPPKVICLSVLVMMLNSLSEESTIYSGK